MIFEHLSAVNKSIKTRLSDLDILKVEYQSLNFHSEIHFTYVFHITFQCVREVYKILMTNVTPCQTTSIHFRGLTKKSRTISSPPLRLAILVESSLNCQIKKIVHR